MSETNTINALKSLLLEDGIISPEAELEALGGGVSCDVFKVKDADRTFVVKRALEKLRVSADWFADPIRNTYEHRYMSEVGARAPGVVPEVIHVNDERRYFCMTWLGSGWSNWKEMMLLGTADALVAAEAASVLGRIHRLTENDANLRQQFDTDTLFYELRLSPYLVATAEKHPALATLIREEIARIQATKDALVHGDYSPKNILVRGQDIMVLDCEVAWYGDSRFDLAFLLNHLLLKGLYHAPKAAGFQTMYDKAVSSYFQERALGLEVADDWNRRTAHLLLMLLLARVDGKSPVEYLVGNEAKRSVVRDFVSHHLPQTLTLAELSALWFARISR